MIRLFALLLTCMMLMPSIASAQNLTTYVDSTGKRVTVTPDTPLPTTDVALPSNKWRYAAAAGGITNTTTAVTIKAAGGAGLFNYITGLQCNSSALGAATELVIRDGAGGTVLWRTYVGTAGLPPMVVDFHAVPLKGSANTLLEIDTLTASVTGAVYCNLQGYTG